MLPCCACSSLPMAQQAVVPSDLLSAGIAGMFSRKPPPILNRLTLSGLGRQRCRDSMCDRAENPGAWNRQASEPSLQALHSPGAQLRNA